MSVYYNKTNVYIDKIFLLLITIAVTTVLGILFGWGYLQSPANIYIVSFIVTLYILLERFSAWKVVRKVRLNRKLVDQ